MSIANFYKIQMFPIFGTIFRHLRQPIVYNVTNNIKSFHMLNKPQELNLLNPISVSLVPNCGLKYKGIVKRRCKDCYFVNRGDQLFVMCHTHGRHKQATFKKKEKNTWTLTHATQSKYRPW